MYRKRFLMAAALISSLAMGAVIAWMIADRAAILRDGKDVVLKTEPVDPRDLLRGRYVRLNYTISNVAAPLFELEAGERLERGATVYVKLEEGADGYWIVKDAAATPPDGGEDIWIRGRARYGVWPASETVAVEYGIERFYTPEADAPEIEKRMRDGMVTDIVVAVAGDGRAQIKALRQGPNTIFTERPF